MSNFHSEIYEEFADKVAGIDKITIFKLQGMGIETLSQLKETDWKIIAKKLNIAEKKLIPLYERVGITLSEEEIKDYRKELEKEKATLSSSMSESKTIIEAPQVLSEDDMKSITEQVKPDITSITKEALSSGAISIRTKNGKTLSLTTDEQKFKKVTITTDMENFIIRLNKESSVTTYLSEIRNMIINSTDKIVPTGARAHVRQWINLLERKVEGRKIGYNLAKLNTPDKFKKELEPLLNNLLDGVRKEIENESISFASAEIEKSRINKSPANISLNSLMHTIILYKIYVDANGSGWDLMPTTGQLGITFSDGEEFMARMKERLGLSKDEPDESPPMMAIKRTWSAYQSGLAVLLAGMPGSGKTFFSKAVGESITDNVWGTLPFTRINITGGLEPQDLLGEWDYQAQILALTASRMKVEKIKDLSDTEIDFLRQNIYTIDYFRFGPVALSMIQGVPILIDEVNRGSPDIQNVLLQAIDENEIVIPGIGRIKATPGFFVISTINEQDVGTTDLGAAFLRRVIYIYFDEPTDYTKWVKEEFPDINTNNSKLISDMEKVRKAIKSSTAISGEIPPSSMSNWARELINIYGPSVVLDKNKIILTLGTLLKNKADIDEVKNNIDAVIRAAGVLS